MTDGRTEPATPKKKQDARRKGMAPRSAELPTALAMVAGVALLPAAVRRLGSVMQADLRLTLADAATSDPSRAGALLGHVALDAFRALAPMVAVLAMGSVAVQLALVGPKPNTHNLRPKFNRISPKAGIKRLVSKQSLYELARNLVKLLLLGLVAYGTWRAGVERLAGASGAPEQSFAVLIAAVRALLERAALLAVLIAVVDVTVSKRRHVKGLRMTKQEVKDESRQSEGNPESKGAIRQRQRKLSRSRMIAAVAKADVVLANPTHLVVALAYPDGAAAPVVVAKGAGSVADRIKVEAARHGVPVVQNKPLARALYRAAEIGDEIPVALYRAVAEVLALVYRARPRRAA